MRLYLGGKMRGLPLFNFPAFFRGARLLREIGHVVMNPAEHDMETGFNPAGGDPTPEELAAMLRWDFTSIMGCDAMVVLPGWESSSGTRQELVVAVATGLRIFELDESLPQVLLRPLHLRGPVINWARS